MICDGIKIHLLIDSQAVVRSLIPSVTGALTWNGSALVDLTYLTNNFTTTTSINNSLATKQANISPGVGLKFSGSTLNCYQLYGNGVQSSLAIDDIMFTGFYVTESLNAGNNRYEYKINNFDLRWNQN